MKESEQFVREFMIIYRPSLEQTLEELLTTFLDFALSRKKVRHINKDKLIEEFIRSHIFLFLMNYPLANTLQDFYDFIKGGNNEENKSNNPNR